jgi:hypothetical protein|tara:strand:+ start:1306 stop:1488 length:183 start_codon:yes stop_codon:yes gene_type:complete
MEGNETMDNKQTNKRPKQKILQIPINDDEFKLIKTLADANGRSVPKHIYIECISKIIKKN